MEKLKQFAFNVCIVGRDEGHSTHATRREAVYQQCNQPGRKACHALLPSIDVCSVSGPPRFVTLIACISINMRQGCSARWRVIERRGGMQEGEGREGVSKHTWAGVA